MAEDEEKLPETIEADWVKCREQIMDIQQLVSNHAESAQINGDRQIIRIKGPDKSLIDELENKEIEYKEV